MSTPARVSRRSMLGLAGAAGAAGLSGGLLGRRAWADQAEPAATVVAFEGTHQAGVRTPSPSHLLLAAFDLTVDDRASLTALLQRWSAAARALTAGGSTGAGAEPRRPSTPPDDTGEAVGLSPARLTVTLGVGPSLFGRPGLGLAARLPAALTPLPSFAGDALDPARSDGDLVVQACSDDPQVLLHLLRTLARLGAGSATLRWSQSGFASAPTDGSTPRNLFGFRDGTANDVADEALWVQPGDSHDDWLVGGTYLVHRRIAMTVETWDRSSLTEQEGIVGRHKRTGAPLGGTAEHDPVDPASLPAGAHVREAHPGSNGGARMLRRGFHFADGVDRLGRLDAGLVFLAFQREPATAFVPVQRRLSRHDLMNEYVRHTASSVCAVLPGVGPGGWWGQALLE